LANCKKISDKKGIAETYTFLSKLALDMGEVELAKSYLDKSHEIATAIKIRYQLLENLRLYANIHLVEKDNQKVIQNQFRYLDLRDSLFKDVIGRNLLLVPIKIKEEEDRIRFSKQEVELRNKSQINTLYAMMLIGAIPILAILIVLLRKNNKALRELHHNNEELKKTQNLLVTSEKMASLGVLAAGVGHEINNPLNYIKNGVVALSRKVKKEDKKLAGDLVKYFEIINEGVDRASKIVRSLGHFSRAGLEENEVSNVENIIDNCLIILSSKTRKINVIKDFNAKNKLVMGNESKLHQVFMNLILNATQAIKRDGEIRISTRISINELIITVEDDGIGIDEENILKISDPFFTTKPAGEGTGLGLFISYAIIEEHNGHINVESKLNKGSKFTVLLPLHKPTK
jgi:signal transduction histidine kinase